MLEMLEYPVGAVSDFLSGTMKLHLFHFRLIGKFPCWVAAGTEAADDGRERNRARFAQTILSFSFFLLSLG